MKIDSNVAVVTGGGSGLGGATAARLSAEGAKVVIFDVNEAAGRTHAEAIGGIFVKVDVSDDQSVQDGFERAHDECGIARILVNCAGVAPAVKTVGKDLSPHSPEVFRKALLVNLYGTFLTTSMFAARLCLADPIGEERGVVINTASVAAFDGQIGQAAYASSKAGVAGMTLPVARDLAQHKIRVMTIAPGIFLTPMLMSLPQPAQDSLGQQVPHPSRLGRPDEFAELVHSILINPMLNGDVIRLDGAIRMAPR